MTSLLPNGSIVLLEGGNKKLMVYGRKQLVLKDGEEETEDLYDLLVFLILKAISTRSIPMYSIILISFKLFSEVTRMKRRRSSKKCLNCPDIQIQSY